MSGCDEEVFSRGEIVRCNEPAVLGKSVEYGSGRRPPVMVRRCKAHAEARLAQIRRELSLLREREQNLLTMLSIYKAHGLF